MSRLRSWALAGAVLASAGPGPTRAGDDEGAFVGALRLVHRHGTAWAVDPRRDETLKGMLFKALGKRGVLTEGGLESLMDASTFRKLAGPDGELDEGEVRRALDAETPDSRRALVPAVAAHADRLATSFDLIDERHREAGARLVDWIVEHYRPGEPLHVTVVCTGNSRRSILGSTMGNVAAAYYGMPEVRFHSGGTAPTAFNLRTIAALKAIGVAVEPTCDEAPRGEPATPNPIYRVTWGSGLETIEFSKSYSDPANPQAGFAALMVCAEADEGCPVVRGASARIAMPFLDPKIYDGSPYEAEKYAERRDDIGRLMLCVMMQARHRLDRPAHTH